MHKLLLATALVAFTAPAFAQLHLNTNSNDPLTNLPPGQWEQLVGQIVHADALDGETGVLIVSSFPVPLTVTCSKWTIVGPDVYKSVKGNPAELKPFSVTYIKTNEFDGYCKDGVIGHYGIGKQVIGRLSSSDGSFTHATTILFSGEGK